MRRRTELTVAYSQRSFRHMPYGLRLVGSIARSVALGNAFAPRRSRRCSGTSSKSELDKGLRQRGSALRPARGSSVEDQLSTGSVPPGRHAALVRRGLAAAFRSLTRCEWHSGCPAPAPTSSSFTTPTAARNTPASTTPRRCPITPSCSRSGHARRLRAGAWQERASLGLVVRDWFRPVLWAL